MNSRRQHHDSVVKIVNSQLPIFDTGLKPIVQITPAIIYWNSLEIHPPSYDYFTLGRPIKETAEHHKLATRA